MYFKVYHKKSKQPIATFNENTIVDFCVSNKDSVKNYYFSEGGQKDLMEWQVFAVKYSDLFEKKADERDRKEFIKAKDEEAINSGNNNSGRAFTLVLLALLFATYLTYYFYQKTLEQESESTISSSPSIAKILVPEEKKDMIEKREVLSADSVFGKDIPTNKELSAAWRNSKKKKIPASLGFEGIKEQMDLYLPALKECYINRAKAGDKGLRGTINMKIRVSGDGIIRDILFTDQKYQSTLFGDCIISAIKSKPFEVFRSPQQIFSYYWNL